MKKDPIYQQLEAIWGLLEHLFQEGVQLTPEQIELYEDTLEDIGQMLGNFSDNALFNY